MLAQVKQAKVLGLTLDEFLIWTKHILTTCVQQLIVDLLYYAGSGGATGRTGEDTSPPVLFKVNFLICPNPVRKMGGGGVRL
jgi:hypothetical protein